MYVLANNTRVVPFFESCMVINHVLVSNSYIPFCLFFSVNINRLAEPQQLICGLKYGGWDYIDVVSLFN